MQPGLGWSEVKGRIHLITVEEEGFRGPVKETAAEMRMGYHLWHHLSLKAVVSKCPIDHLRTEPLQQLPEQRRPHRSEQETESAGKEVRGPEGQAWHLWGRAEN